MGQSSRLMELSIRGRALSVDGSTLSAQDEVRNDSFYVSTGQSEDEAPGIPPLDVILLFYPIVSYFVWFWRFHTYSCLFYLLSIA